MKYGEYPALFDFLRARFAEEEDLAADGGDDVFGPVYVEGYGDYALIGGDRLRAELAAKRKLLDGFELEYPEPSPWNGCGDDCEWKALGWAIQVLAAVYSSHPDYRKEWAA